MIECIFTLDYEIYGNGTGTLKELVYDPGERLLEIFRKWDARFVAFVEVAEFKKIEEYGTDPSIELVKRQIQEFNRDGFEIGLHLHPQWFNARHENGCWLLDYAEYNLCTLSRLRIAQIVDESLGYLQRVLNQSDFTPLSFRAGNWLFQPTETAASVLADKGIKIDSSVFKGGLQHNNGLDYRGALQNGYYWAFSSEVIEPDAMGPWIEVPIHTELVPFWKMPTSKRMSFGNNFGIAGQSSAKKWNRIRDFLRFRYPLKLDFCRMTLNELTSMVDKVLREDKDDPSVFRPIVTIGHTKDLSDPQTVDAFLSYLRANNVAVSTFEGIYSRLLHLVGELRNIGSAPSQELVARAE